MRLRLILLVATVVMLGCSCSYTSTPTTPPTGMPTATANPNELPGPGQPNTRGGLTIQVTGTCQDVSGFRLSSRGFTPNGEYRTQAWYPDGTPYTHLFDGGKGRADATGSTPNWTWDCKDGANNRPDPNGIYIIKMTDVTTGHWVMARMEVKL